MSANYPWEIGNVHTDVIILALERGSCTPQSHSKNLVNVTGSLSGPSCPETVEEFATSQGQADRPILVLGV